MKSKIRKNTVDTSAMLDSGEFIMRILQLLAKGESLFIGTLDDEDKQTLYPTHHIAQPSISLNGALWS